ncbi:MAG: hypothetical protein QOK29_2466 [Rhodospirillaceae bacterium]|nr:hypothetical protein [Rhodospirillaceae bacterium]
MMSKVDSDQRGAPPLAAGRALRVPTSAALDLVAQAAMLLFANGQTTEHMERAAEQLAEALGYRAAIFPRWGELAVQIDGDSGPHYQVVPGAPMNVDIRKVIATLNVIDEICNGRMGTEAARSDLEAVRQLPPLSLARFALLATAGAMALGVIYGAADLVSLVLIGLSAGAGACLRRWLATRSGNPFVQPFCAALVAGVIGAIVVHLHLGTLPDLVAVCPCMVLVPGAHFLNGSIDLARVRIALGIARIGYASVIIVMICAGLLIGLSLGGVTLPVSEPFYRVPLGYDVIAAGVAVAAYGTFSSMPWKMLPIPVLIGMLAHAARWGVISIAGTRVELGALVACLTVGSIVTPIANRMRLPFAAVAFASVVSLMPGIFLFRMAEGLVGLIALQEKATSDLLIGTIADGGTAFLIILAIAFGLTFPNMYIERAGAP